jgi:hypothetical protein
MQLGFDIPRVLLASGVAGRDRRFGSWMNFEGIGSRKA